MVFMSAINNRYERPFRTWWESPWRAHNGGTTRSKYIPATRDPIVCGRGTERKALAVRLGWLSSDGHQSMMGREGNGGEQRRREENKREKRWNGGCVTEEVREISWCPRPRPQSASSKQRTNHHQQSVAECRKAKSVSGSYRRDGWLTDLLAASDRVLRGEAAIPRPTSRLIGPAGSAQNCPR